MLNNSTYLLLITYLCVSPVLILIHHMLCWCVFLHA